MKNFVVFSILSIFILGCSNESQKAIESYSGDGKIEYVESANLLHLDGIRIQFYKFDLSKDYNAKYRLQNLPPGDPYAIYFVVPDPAAISNIKNSHLHITLLLNTRKIAEKYTSIGTMTNNIRGTLNRFYWYEDPLEINTIEQDAVNPKDLYTIEFKYQNISVKEKVSGYLVLERGGVK